jgi:hypothetical protein
MFAGMASSWLMTALVDWQQAEQDYQTEVDKHTEGWAGDEPANPPRINTAESFAKLKQLRGEAERKLAAYQWAVTNLRL